MQVDRVWNKDQESTAHQAELYQPAPHQILGFRGLLRAGAGLQYLFNMQQQNTYSRSIPISRLANCAYSELLDIITEVRQTYHFTLNYLNFNEEQVREMRRMFR